MKYLTIGFIIGMFLEFGHCGEFPYPSGYTTNQNITVNPYEFSYIEFTDSKGFTAGQIRWDRGHVEFKGLASDEQTEMFFIQKLKPIIDKYLQETKCRENS